MKFYESLQVSSSQDQRIRVIVLDEKNLGQQALLYQDKWVYQDSHFPANELSIKEISVIDQTSIIEMNAGRFFVEPLECGHRLVVCGGGHISLAIIPIAKMIGFSVCVVEDRLFFANEAKKAGADEVICAPFAQGISEAQQNDRPYYVIATRGHNHDHECLKAIERNPRQYIGMIGSRRRVKMIKELLVQEGISHAFLEELHAPIGLAIDAQTPAEIAISILAQIIEEKNQQAGSIDFSKEMIDNLEKYAEQPIALATIIARKGSTPREAGAKMLILPDGQCIDTIGGGCVEAEVKQKALQCIQDRQSMLLAIDMTAEQVEEEGMVCGGVVDVLIQTIY